MIFLCWEEFVSPELTGDDHNLHEERWELLKHINDVTEKPMIALAFVWVFLLILDFTVGLNPLLQSISYVIWALFILDFLSEFVIAPKKGRYLRNNWLTVISLVLPAFRILRVFRVLRVFQAARAARTVSLFRVVTSVNRGMRATATTLGRRNIGYVVALTLIILFVGAAGMAAFESPDALREAGYSGAVETGAGFSSYAEAVWWTAMILTTIGSSYWPITVEGRILCWLLSIYALAVFGYITAAVASHFVGIDREARRANQNATTSDSVLQQEIAALRKQILDLNTLLSTERRESGR